MLPSLLVENKRASVRNREKDWNAEMEDRGVRGRLVNQNVKV